MLFASSFTLALEQRSLADATSYYNLLSFNVSGTTAADMGYYRDYAYGDFNLDGVTDLAVGFQTNNSVGVSINIGSVNIYYGSAQLGLPLEGELTPNVTINQLDTGGVHYYFGRAVASGDFNNDGFDDLAISDDLDRVYVVYGGVSSILNNQSVHTVDAFDTRLARYDGQGASAGGGSQLGDRLAFGDVNGDGIDDLVMGAGAFNTPDFSGGRIYVAYGGASTPVAGDVLFVRDMNNTDVRFDMELSSATIFFGGNALNGEMFVEDFNGDGYGDIFFGLATSTRFLSNGGMAMAVKGGAFSNQNISVVNEANYLFQFTTEGISLMGDNARYSDVNGDGQKDLIVTCRGTTGNNCSSGSQAGAVKVFYAPLPSDGRNLSLADADLTIEGEVAGDQMSRIVMADTNGDGYDDLVISAIGNDFGNTNGGQIYIVLLPNTATGTTGVATIANYSFYGTLSSQQAGRALIGGNYLSEKANLIAISFNAGTANGFFYVLNTTFDNLQLPPAIVTVFDDALNETAGNSVNFYAFATDNYNLSSATFEFNGVNTTIGLSGTSAWANFTDTAIEGTNEYRYYFTDENGNMASSALGSFIATAPVGESNYRNIDLGAGVGETFGVILRGTVQIVAHTTDDALSQSNGLLELLAITFSLVALGFVLANGEKAVKMIDKMM